MTDYCENGKPKDCRYCYYYGRHSCMLKVCHYDRPRPETKPVSECDDCPYGKCGPCIGWCKQNSLIFHFLRKSCSLDGIGGDVVQRVQDWLNRLPR